MNEIGMQTVMTFGKFKGKTGEFVARSNPSYVLWMEKNLTRFSISPALRSFAIGLGMMESEWAARQYGSAADWGFSEF